VFDRRRAAPALAALVLALAVAAGCSQEGKLIDTPLAVNGVAYEDSAIGDTNRVHGLGDSVISVLFKISVHANNPCELHNTLLELRREGSTVEPVFIIKPVARYNADDACNSAPPGSGDTVLTLRVFPLLMAQARPALVSYIKRFRIETSTGPGISVVVDSTKHPTTLATVVFDVRVEADSTGGQFAVPVAGATVTVEQLGSSPATLGSGTTDVDGKYTLSTPCLAPVGEQAIPYRVTATDGVTTRVLSIPTYPALGQTIERVVVRL
jgi:hypothetical protein